MTSTTCYTNVCLVVKGTTAREREKNKEFVIGDNY
jgi:hypothetical protein